tara:strand:- start:346 stop:1263 length:918 start_codon:yes stop_codon:yes gene_type:complete
MGQGFYFYSCYGQTIKSRIDLSSLKLSSFSPSQIPEIDIEIKVLDKKIKNLDLLDNQTSINLDYGYYHRKGLALFEFLDGREINVTRYVNTDINEDFIRILLNYPIACLLYQKGYFLLHASAVSYLNKVFLFPGKSLSGKSTIAAFLIKQGGKLITEDTAVIKIEQEKALIFPSYPLIKISDQANNNFKFFKEDGIFFPKEANKRKGYFLSKEKAVKDEMPIDYCIFPRWTNGETKLKENDLKSSLNLLLESSLSIYPLTQEKEKDLFQKNIQLLKHVDSLSYLRQKKFSSLLDLKNILNQKLAQ